MAGKAALAIVNSARAEGEPEKDSTANPFRRAAIYFFAGALGGVCNIGLTIVLLRLLSDVGYKSIGLALSASVFVAALAFEWLRIYALRFGAESNRIGFIYILYVLSALIVALAAGAMFLLSAGGPTGVMAGIVAAIAIVQAAGDFLIVIARGSGNSPMVLLIQAGRGLFALAACGATAAVSRNPQDTLLAYTVAHGVIAIVTVASFQRALPPPRRLTRSATSSAVGFGAPMMVSALVNSLLSLSDRWVITLSGRHFSDAAIGGYIAVSDIYVRTLSFFSGVLVGAFMQDIAAAFDRGEHKQSKMRFELMTTVFASVAAPILSASLMLGADIQAILFSGKSSELTSFVLAVEVAAITAHITRNGLIETLLIVEKRTFLVLAINVGCLAGAYLLSFALMPALGVAGAPIAFLVASLIAGACGLAMLAPETRSLIVLGPAIRFLLAAFALGIVCRLLLPDNVSPWLRLGTFAVTYGCVLFALGQQELRKLQPAPSP